MTAAPRSSDLLRLATRGSPLALEQARQVKALLEACHAKLRVELVPIKTQGDILLDTPLAQIGGKGLFVREIEECLLKGEADLAVHSLKDLPALMPDGLALVAFPKREDPRDVLVGRRKITALSDFAKEALLGTTSVRRQALLWHQRPDLRFSPLRGNVGTRITKLEQGEGDLDGIVLAAAGLNRLGMSARIGVFLDPEIMIPAVGQGSLAIEARGDDEPTRALLAPLHDDATARAVTCERAFLEVLEASCQVPVGAYAQIDGKRCRVKGFISSLDGKRFLEEVREGALGSEREIGLRLAEDLLARGGRQILDELKDPV